MTALPTLILAFQPPGCEGIDVCCLSHWVCGALYGWQPEPANAGLSAQCCSESTKSPAEMGESEREVGDIIQNGTFDPAKWQL